MDLGSLTVYAFPGLNVSGERLDIYPPDAMIAAGANKPIISIQRFAFRAGYLGLFLKPMHSDLVRVTGLKIDIPSHDVREASASEKKDADHHDDKIAIEVDKIVCEDSRLTMENSKPDKDPKVFELKRIELRNVGSGSPWNYDAILTNAVPRGEIQAKGTFGPWQTDEPGDSSVTGRYTFEHADLGTIKGIAGILSSKGEFKGRLDRIVVDGTTETPNFALDTADHSMPLHTRFHAIVDGTNGDTYLQPVEARLGDSRFTVQGNVINIKGPGHRIELDVDVPNDPVQDFLALAVKTEPPIMTGTISTKAKLQIPPGHESVTKKLILDGTMTMRGVHFTNPKVQDRVDMLSLRARGKPKQAVPGAQDVNSRIDGQFHLQDGALNLRKLVYVVPGAQANLEGVYSLDGQQFDLHGKILTDASLSELTDSKWSFLLKMISPFFRHDGKGAEIPVSISGAKSEPKFGLDIFKHHPKPDTSAENR